MTVLYLMQTDQLADETLFWDRYHTLSPARQQKIDRFIFPKDKNLSLAAGLLLQAGLADYGLREQELIIAHTENGKPYLPEYPDLFFNIAHSENLAVCAFSRQEIGVDVEKVTAIDLAIAKQFFYGSEYQAIIASDCPEETFFDYWVLKESYMKATGRGFALPLEAFWMAFENEDEIRVYQDGILLPYGFYQTTVYETYKLAVCVKGDSPELRMDFREVLLP